RVLGVRRDVTLVTVPLLPTVWYRSELARRHFLLTEREVERYNGILVAAADVAAGARRLGLPVAASITMTPAERERIGPGWAPSGFVFLEGGNVDTIAEKRWAAWVDQRVHGAVRPAID